MPRTRHIVCVVGVCLVCASCGDDEGPPAPPYAGYWKMNIYWDNASFPFSVERIEQEGQTVWLAGMPLTVFEKGISGDGFVTLFGFNNTEFYLGARSGNEIIGEALSYSGDPRVYDRATAFRLERVPRPSGTLDVSGPVDGETVAESFSHAYAIAKDDLSKMRLLSERDAERSFHGIQVQASAPITTKTYVLGVDIQFRAWENVTGFLDGVSDSNYDDGTVTFSEVSASHVSGTFNVGYTGNPAAGRLTGSFSVDIVVLTPAML